MDHRLPMPAGRIRARFAGSALALAVALAAAGAAALAARPASSPTAATSSTAAAASTLGMAGTTAIHPAADVPRSATSGSALSASDSTSRQDGSGTGPCTTPLAVGGGQWRDYGHDPSNTRTQPDEHTIGTAQAGSLKPAWVFALSSVGDSGQLNSTPVVVGGCAFVTASNGGVYAVNAATGALVWRHLFTVITPGLGGAIVGGVTVDGSQRVDVIVNETGDAAGHGPYVAALDINTGSLVWASKPLNGGSGYYSNATPQVIDDAVFAGFSPAEGDSAGQGGFALVDAESGNIIKVTDTISAADQAQGFAGGGIWSTPAWDPHSGFAYVGAGNPYSKTQEDPHTNAILKVDLRDGSPTFGAIVAAYKGNVDQYTQSLQALSQTPLCSASATAPDPLDDPACGQLDLDFGAAPNLFTANGHQVVGDLQKAGVYHVADAGSMAPVWSTIVGATCQACNAASTAVDGATVLGESAPGGVLFGLDRSSGSRQWLTPVADGTHYEAISEADGVVYTIDTAGFFDAFDAASGLPIMRRQMTQDTSFPMGALTSGGIAIAYHTLYVGASGGPGNGLPEAGFLIAYRAG
jgi:polyvinyl alcohol dehydrogenase (cytochrome)